MIHLRPLAKNSRSRRYYSAHPEKWTAYRTKRVNEIRTFLLAHKKEHPCVDCGEDDPVVLDFDHRDPKEKSFGISKRATGSIISIVQLEIEIAKCDIRCANCHRRKTKKERELCLS